MKLLVCGGAGFIGSAFIRNHLKTKLKDIITNLDSLTIGSNIQNLKEVENNPNYKFIKDDIRNQETISNLV
ncbi:MAG: GDP-mannose 4,6-dehydratase, partial [Thaumarchaeota archaeon]|nr:GDP-mannose 4,6-dehydratase [Nitrososphaerota archaeon]